MKFPFPTHPEECGDNRLITFISLMPGAGATTLACMTAAFMGKGTALVDLSQAGKIRAYTGTTPDVCSVSVLDASAVRSFDDIRTIGVEHPEGVYIIPGPVRLLDQVDSGVTAKVARSLKHTFAITVAVSGPLSKNGWPLVMQSDHIVLVMRPERADVDVFRENMELLARLDAAERTIVVLNQTKQPGCLNAEETIRYVKPSVVIPYDVEIRRACNQRKVFSVKNKAEGVARCLTTH